MQAKIKRVFWAIEVNLILWVMVVGITFGGQLDEIRKYVVGAGFIFAALFQHWAYYGLYRAAKRMETKDGSAPAAT